eukprot:TRINITY_DN2152_c0_g1_i3.p1 TRINITY_DN2152_c0_g1~~TRINITY_DN2152_c0_g1_i3.p1  ORF type:complete len:500 (+),score=72.96 TRINITY_DN2152_c0_g1_i3:48-1502(+)
MDLVEHTWYRKNFKTVRHCNNCKAMLFGTGFRCEICQCVVHKQCREKILHNCLPGDIPVDNRSSSPTNTIPTIVEDNILTPTDLSHSTSNLRSSTPTETTQPILQISDRSVTSVLNMSNSPDKKSSSHHMVRGNIGIGKKCHICLKSLSFKGFEACRCSKCHNTFHVTCAQASTNCAPEHDKLIYKGPELASEEEVIEGAFNDDHTPLVVFINPRSGGQQGHTVFRKMKSLLSRSQVFDITQGGPGPGLERYKNIPNVRILACGGDGTIGWILSQMDKINYEIFPPVGVLPLGTGNDLAQALGWGAGYSGEPLSSVLRHITDAEIVALDRWKLVCTRDANEDLPPEVPRELVFQMMNYFSVGVDAKVVLSFHQMRETKPQFFQNRLVNKGWYGKFGMENMIYKDGPLSDMIEVTVDGSILPLKKKYHGLILLNVPSYGGGSDLWGTKKAVGTVIHLPTFLVFVNKSSEILRPSFSLRLHQCVMD